MKSKRLLSTFSRMLFIALLSILFGKMEAVAQSGYGDFIIFEDFGRAIPNHPDHERYSSAQNDGGGTVYFRKESWADIIPGNLLFYIPSNPPSSYGVPTSGSPSDRLNHQNNWGPQYQDNVGRGSYSIVTNSRGYRNVYFHGGLDHTPGDGNFGYMLLVDAHSTTELYFDREIDGLCAGTRFEFSAWVKDVNNEGFTKPEIRFVILNEETDDVIAESTGTTNDVDVWEQITMDFVMPASVNKIRLQIFNAVSEHTGNDIAIDDIGFRPMGPKINFSVSPETPICIGGDVIFTVRVEEVTEAYTTNHFILQRRPVGSSGEWENVPGTGIETSTGINPVTFTINEATEGYDNYEYRAIVAGDETTLESENCRAVSDPILLRVRNHLPEISVSDGSHVICENEAVQLNVVVSGGIDDSPVYTYVWEKSTDQDTWEIISGATEATLNTGSLDQTTYYRVIAYTGGEGGCPGAGVSEVLVVTVNPLPDAPVSGGDQVVCESDPIQTLTATATVPDGHTIIWYDADGNVVVSPTLNTVGTITYYAASRVGTEGCESDDRTAVTLTINAAPAAPEVADQVTYVGATGIEYDATALLGHTLIWFDENGNTLDPNEKPIVSTTEPGVFTAYVAQQNDETGCLSEIVVVRVIVNPVGILVSKSVVQTSMNAPGTLDYSIEIENTGSFDLTDVQVTDVLSQSGESSQTLPIGTVTESITTNGILEIGEKWTYTFAYDAIQSQIDNGNDLVNTVSVVTHELPGPSTAIATTSIERNPDVNINKVADKTTISEAGELITYTITVENAGNVTLRNYTVKDVLFPDWSASIDELVPNATREFELVYEVTQGDIDNGGVVNVVSVGGDNPDDPTDEDEEEVPSDKRPGIEVTKVADRTTVSEAGELIVYTITVENTGNVTLRNYTVKDVLFPDWSASIETLAPGATREFELEYEVTQGDIDNGGVVNVASVGGDNPDDPTDEDEIEVPSDKKPGISINKVADRTTVSEAGELIVYTITVENTGNVTLRNYTVKDILFPDWSASIDELAPNATREFELVYEVTQGDIDNGGVVNVVSVGGDNPDDPTDEDEIEVPSDKRPGIEVTKVADRTTVSEAGELITYTITVENTGNVTLRNYTVRDVLFPDWSASIETLAPGATREFELEYEVTQDDIDNGGVVNVVSVGGDNPDDPTDEDDEEVPSDKRPGIEVTKVADRTTVSEAGELIVYTITVENTGNVTLRNYTVKDVLFPDWSASIDELTPNATLEFELVYTVTQDDIDNGGVINVASVGGENPEDPDDEDEIEVPVENDGRLRITKEADRESFNQVGDMITYTIVVTNTGNVTLSNVIVTDVLFPNWSETIETFAPAAARSFELKYTVTQADVNKGHVVNVARVKGEGPNGETPESETEIEVPGEFAPVANDDDAETNQGEPITITVITNDEEGSSPIVPESVRLIDPVTGESVTTVTIEGEGTYVVDADGKVTFTPEEGYIGNSTINYTVKDENGLESNEATISIIVVGVAAEVAPTAADDTQTTQYGQPIDIAVLNNDTEGSSPIVPSTVRLIDENGNRVSVVTVSGEGRYEVNGQGIVTFTPADGFTGASTVQYEVSDENGLVSNVATITVTVNTRPFKIPNVFTPNGDGRNDVFEIVGIEGFDRVEITVVNRWGNEVYRNNNYRNNWDGQGLNEGTYYYVIITHDGGRQDRHVGWVLIKRQ